MGRADHVAKSLEDPRKMLDQAVSEMKEDLVKMRQASAEVLSTQKMLETKYTQAQASAVSPEAFAYTSVDFACNPSILHDAQVRRFKRQHLYGTRVIARAVCQHGTVSAGLCSSMLGHYSRRTWLQFRYPRLAPKYSPLPSQTL